MTACDIIAAARREGLRLSLTPSHTILAGGPREVVARWEPELRQHKPALIEALAQGTVSTDGPEVHRCACGAVGVIGAGWFLREPTRARWYCGPCFRRIPAAGCA
jgi:hypothetical protein